jgi:hypothetical protein
LSRFPRLSINVADNRVTGIDSNDKCKQNSGWNDNHVSTFSCGAIPLPIGFSNSIGRQSADSHPLAPMGWSVTSMPVYLAVPHCRFILASFWFLWRLAGGHGDLMFQKYGNMAISFNVVPMTVRHPRSFHPQQMLAIDFGLRLCSPCNHEYCRSRCSSC